MPPAAATMKPTPPVSNPVAIPPTKASVAPLQIAATAPARTPCQKVSPPPTRPNSAASNSRIVSIIPDFPFSVSCPYLALAPPPHVQTFADEQLKQLDET